MPWLYQRYVGHDNNRDMYMYTQQETRLIGEILWKEWFPSIWLDEHQMGSRGARIFVMPATDPINNNVHPLIYRLNGIFGQAQGGGAGGGGEGGDHPRPDLHQLLAGGHGVDGVVAQPGGDAHGDGQRPHRHPDPPGRGAAGAACRRRGAGGGVDTTRTRSRRPPPTSSPGPTTPGPGWEGVWTLRDIVDYELIVSMATLETAADNRERLNRQIYEVNRSTIEEFLEGEPTGGPTDELGGYGPLPSRVACRTAGDGAGDAGRTGSRGDPLRRGLSTGRGGSRHQGQAPAPAGEGRGDRGASHPFLQRRRGWITRKEHM